MSVTLNQRQLDTLLSNTVQNSRNNSHYLSITTKSGKATIYLLMPVIDGGRNNVVNVDEVPEPESKKFGN